MQLNGSTGRQGVTIDEVRQAASALTMRGEPPTQENIRKELGGGSMSTINRLLRQLREGEASQQIPDRLMACVRVLVAEARASVAEEVKALKADCDTAVEAADREAGTAKALRARAEEELRLVQQRLADSDRAREAQLIELTSARQQHGADVNALEQLQSALAQERASVAHVRGELETQARAHDQVLQQHRAEVLTRTQELGEARELVQQLRADLQARDQQLADQARHLVQLRGELAAGKQELVQAQRDLQEHSRELARVRDEALNLTSLRTLIDQMMQQLGSRLEHLEQQVKVATPAPPDEAPAAATAEEATSAPPPAATAAGKTAKPKSTPPKRTPARA